MSWQLRLSTIAFSIHRIGAHKDPSVMRQVEDSDDDAI
jgi:hypothetical protein